MTSDDGPLPARTRVVRHCAHSNVAAQTCFEYIAELSNLPRWLYGVTSVQVSSAPPIGVGTEVRLFGRIGPVNVSEPGRIAEFARDRMLVLETSGGTFSRIRMAFEVEAEASGVTRIDVTVTYSLPNGITGRLLDKAMRAVLTSAITSSESALQCQLDALDDQAIDGPANR